MHLGIFVKCTILDNTHLDNTHLVCPKWARWILRAMITRTVMTMEETAVLGWRRGGGGDDASDDAGDGVGGRGARAGGTYSRPRACVCVCVCAAAELADVTATMLVMVVADAEPVRVAHIRGSPAACMCVCVWRRRRQQTSCLRADCRLLLWLTLLGCIADLAGAAPSLRLGGGGGGVLLTGGLQASSVAHATGLHCGSGRSCPQLAAGDIARS